MICSSQTVRLVNHCFTTRTSCTSRTGRGIVYTTDYIGSSPSNNIQFTNCTTCKPLFHDPYESNGSCKKENAITRVVSVRVYWTTLKIYTLNYREMQLEDGRFLMAAERYDALLKVFCNLIDHIFFL